MTKRLNREEAEKVADELIAHANTFKEDMEAKNPGMFMTDEHREARGIPDTTDIIRERMINILMNPEDFDD